jgi:hypothetical protein
MTSSGNPHHPLTQAILFTFRGINHGARTMYKQAPDVRVTALSDAE